MVALYRAGLVILDSRDPETLLPQVVELAMKALQADDASLLLTNDRGDLELAYSHRLKSAKAREPRLATRVAQLREPVLLRHGLDDERVADLAGDSRVRSAIVYPLIKDDRVLGVLNINRISTTEAFDTADLQRATVLVSMIVLSLENARLFHELEQRVAELSSAQSQLVHSEKMAAFGQLAAGVAHEINNPAAFINTNLGQLEQRVATVAEVVKAAADGASPHELRRLAGGDLVGLIREASELLSETSVGFARIVGIVDELRSFGRIGQRSRERFPLRLAALSALKLCRNELQHRGRLRVNLPPDIHVVGDQARLSQVVLNLVLNAAQSLDEGRSADNTVGVSLRRAGEWAELDVTDTGCGIPDELLSRVFEPFYTTKDGQRGTGLGLAVCHEIVESHGGRITVSSKPGRGSCFTVRLPLAVHQSWPAEPETTSPKSDGPREDPLSSMRLLLVDDEPALLRALKRSLGRRHDVYTAENGEEALSLLANTAIDGVICDLMMPGIGGQEVYQRACEMDPSLAGRFVFLTGDAFTPRARAFAEQHRDRVVLKPFDLLELEALVRSVVASA